MPNTIDFYNNEFDNEQNRAAVVAAIKELQEEFKDNPVDGILNAYAEICRVLGKMVHHRKFSEPDFSYDETVARILCSAAWFVSEESNADVLTPEEVHPACEGGALFFALAEFLRERP